MEAPLDVIASWLPRRRHYQLQICSAESTVQVRSMSACGPPDADVRRADRENIEGLVLPLPIFTTSTTTIRLTIRWVYLLMVINMVVAPSRHLATNNNSSQVACRST